MEIRHAKKTELGRILEIVDDGRKFLAYQGIDQWRRDYPDEIKIGRDISRKEGYVVICDDRICAYFALCDSPEPVYANIENGVWLSYSDNYKALHRVCVASDMKGRGIAHEIYNFGITSAINAKCDSIRVDTHNDNKIMRHCAESHGFAYCGDVYYGDPKRVAYEKLL